jgi:type VI secretion system protein ImpM
VSKAAINAVAGLYGKVPSSRDFLRRGLPNRFVLSWDNWLAQTIHAAQETLGDAWMHAYLTSPPWRFALDPQLIDEDGWFGVVVSSVDTLNRCFPLTIAAASSLSLEALLPVFDFDGWMARIETLALALIDGSRGADDLASELNRLAVELADAGMEPAPGAAASQERWRSAYDLQTPVAAATPVAFSYWWHDEWPEHAAVALRCRGLPPVAAAPSYFDSTWGAPDRPPLSPARLA